MLMVMFVVFFLFVCFFWRYTINIFTNHSQVSNLQLEQSVGSFVALKLLFPGENFPEILIIWYLNVIIVPINFLKKAFVWDVADKIPKKVIQVFLWAGLCNPKDNFWYYSCIQPKPLLERQESQTKTLCSARLYPSWVLLEGDEGVTCRHCLWSYLKLFETELTARNISPAAEHACLTTGNQGSQLGSLWAS